MSPSGGDGLALHGEGADLWGGRGRKDLAPEPRGRRSRCEDKHVPAGLRVWLLPAASSSVAEGCWVIQGLTLALVLTGAAISGQRPRPSEGASWPGPSSSCVAFVISVYFLKVMLPTR